ncbi:MAG TPA: FkbM family methyltransferase [Vicinamibacterales bacterium]|jgi:FkbM family methyltransferase|nr:FkbM family methyltransferase [Vicinamibacterales bacterium]
MRGEKDRLREGESTSARRVVKRWLRRLGLVAQRWPATRFSATDAALALLCRNGFRPDVVIDVGANRGQWTSMARETFPDAVYHLVEPQHGCLPMLKQMAARSPRIHVHATAVTRPNVPTVMMVGGGDDKTGTGNFIPTRAASAAGDNPMSYPSTTLDALFGNLRPPASRLLLKLDVEGHELAVLEGARALLRDVEVLVSEFWMFRIDGETMATLPELMATLEDAGFILYDIGALQGRRSDNRLTSGDAIFVRRDSPLVTNSSWR